MFRKGNGQHLPDAVGSFIPVGHRVTDALTGLVQQHKIHRPSVDAHGGRRKACGAAGGHAVDDLGGEGVHIPAEMPVFAGNPVFKTVDLLQLDAPVLHPADDVPPAGCADIHGQITSLHWFLL